MVGRKNERSPSARPGGPRWASAHINLTSDLSTFVVIFFAFLAVFFADFFNIFRSFFCLPMMPCKLSASPPKRPLGTA
jgi:hypothetical protein